MISGNFKGWHLCSKRCLICGSVNICKNQITDIDPQCALFRYTPLIPLSAAKHVPRAILPSARRAPTERFPPRARRAYHRASYRAHQFFCLSRYNWMMLGERSIGRSVGRSASARWKLLGGRSPSAQQDCSPSMLGSARWD